MRTISFTSFAQKYATAMALGAPGEHTPVTFSGKTAWTDNKRINLPALPPGTMLTPWEAKVFTGYLDHEIGHKRYTDFRHVNRPMNPLKPSFREELIVFGLFNLFEDIREENQYIAEYPPVKNYLDACGQQIEYDRRMKTGPKTAADTIFDAIFREAYETYRKMDVTWEIKTTIGEIPELAAVATAMKKLAALRSTKQAVELAREIYQLLPKVDYSEETPEPMHAEENAMPVPMPGGQGEPEDPQTPPTEGAGEGKGDSKPAEEKQDGQAGKQQDKKEDEPETSEDDPEGAADPGDDPEEPEKDGEATEEGTEEQPSGKGELREEPRAPPRPGDPGSEQEFRGGQEEDEEETVIQIMVDDLEALKTKFEEMDRPGQLRAFLEQILEENLPQLKLRAAIKQQWQGQEVLPPAGRDKDNILQPARKNKRAYEAARATVLPQITAMKKMLNIALRARTKKAWERGLPDGDLDEIALPSLFTGDTNLFKEKRTTHLVDTAVQIMVDQSGSMSAITTRAAAIMTAEAMQGVRGLKLAIAGFTTNGSYSYDTEEGTGRIDILDFPLYKEFEEPYEAIKDRLGSLDSTGSTPLGDAYAFGMERLIARKEPRKVLWIITDGDPAVTTGDGRHNEYLLCERVFRRCREEKIKIVLFNIGKVSARLKQYADVTKTVKDFAELTKEMIGMVRDIAA